MNSVGGKKTEERKDNYYPSYICLDRLKLLRDKNVSSYIKGKPYHGGCPPAALPDAGMLKLCSYRGQPF